MRSSRVPGRFPSPVPPLGAASAASFVLHARFGHRTRLNDLRGIVTYGPLLSTTVSMSPRPVRYPPSPTSSVFRRFWRTGFSLRPSLPTREFFLLVLRRLKSSFTGEVPLLSTFSFVFFISPSSSPSLSAPPSFSARGSVLSLLIVLVARPHKSILAHALVYYAHPRLPPSPFGPRATSLSSPSQEFS